MFRKITCIAIVLTLAALLCIQACKPSSCIKKDGYGEQKPCSEESDKKLSWAEKLVYVPPLPECKEKDGEIYGKIGRFRHRWWHYYKRALSYMEGGFWDEAEKDLKKAIHQRGEDQWDARTYGMHFIDYFPHRELGVVYYLKGEKDKLPLSLKELRTSLQQTPTAKTLYYLEPLYQKTLDYKNELIRSGVDKECLTEMGLDDVEKSYPKITIEKGTHQETREDIITVSGYVEDENYIKSVAIRFIKKDDNKKSMYEEDDFLFEPIFLLNSREDLERNLGERQLSILDEQAVLRNLKTKVSFTKQLLFLPSGTHNIEVRAENVMGCHFIQPLKIVIDRSAPIINVKKKQRGKEKIDFSISASDQNNISHFSVNGKIIDIEKGGNIVHCTETLANSLEKLDLEAMDNFGNKARYIQKLSPLSYASHKLFANAGSFIAQQRFHDERSSDKKPTITIVNWPSDGIIYMKDEFPINVEIQDDTEIQSVKIKDVTIFEKGKSDNRYEYFNIIRKDSHNFVYPIDLTKENRIEATDIDGETSEIIIREGSESERHDNLITFQRGTYEAFKTDNRLKILVIPFVKGKNSDIINVNNFQEKLIKAIHSIHHIRKERRFGGREFINIGENYYSKS